MLNLWKKKFIFSVNQSLLVPEWMMILETSLDRVNKQGP